MANCSFATAIVAGLLTLLLEVKAVINAFPHDQRMHDSSDRIGRPVRSANISTVSAAFTGDVFMVYNFSSQHCPKLPQPWCKVDIERGCDPDIPDAPVSMWRRTGGDGKVFALSSTDVVSRGLLGNSVLDLSHDCHVYANSTRFKGFQLYANYEWIQHGWYFRSNNSVYALTHMEWDCKDIITCAWQPGRFTFFSAVTLMVSTDGGRSWTHARKPPDHLIAAQPVQWNTTVGLGANFGFRSPSNIVAARDGSGWYYATVEAEWGTSRFGQAAGACMMRTRDVTDPSSWRAWGGVANGFSIILNANPYLEQKLDPSEHLCEPFTNMTYPSLAWSTFYSKYLIMGTEDGNDSAGWAFALSDDLSQPQSWSAPVSVDLGGYIVAAGNGTVTRTSVNISGRFLLSQNPSQSQVWWENDAKTGKWAVGSCTPCPNVSACGTNIVRVPQSDLDALPDMGSFSCSKAGLYKAVGVGAYLYPRLIDPDSDDDNFGTVGETAQLFLVTNNCVAAKVTDNEKVVCTPWTANGILHRDIVRIPVKFSIN